MSNTFKAGDKVVLRYSTIDLSDNGRFVEYNNDGLTATCEVDGYTVTWEVQHILVPYPEYAADLATYRDAVATGKVQGQLGQDAALLRLIGYLLGEGGGE